MSKMELNMSDLISPATKRNWERLNYSADTKLHSRANKKLSKKFVVPLEYLSNQQNKDCICELINYIHKFNYRIEDVLYTLSVNLLMEYNLAEQPYVKKVLSQYSDYNIIKDLLNVKLPTDENDILGVVYQSILSEGERNTSGIYYTAHNVAVNMTKELDFSQGQLFLDPCCGSGAFLLALNAVEPYQIIGFDKDPIAVMLAKVNLMIKYRKFKFIPQIYCLNFLNNNQRLLNKFNYIVTNPPWGVDSNVQSNSDVIVRGESFSLFFQKAYDCLLEGGIVRFLFPEAILNVKAHKNIREYMLKNGDLRQITYYPDIFSGVTTKIIDILQIKTKQTANVRIYKGNEIYSTPKTSFLQTTNCVFNILDNQDIEIIEKVKKISKYNLKDSIWALGIVTGDNKTKLKKNPEFGFEKIYSGKEIIPYKINPARNYILYDRTQLQQVAKDEYYRAKEKLVYKFISNKLVFAYDNTSSLFLNSANILIPKIPGMSIKSVLGFLNSELYQYLYISLFGEVKILKGNLIELPFPKLTSETDKILSEYVQHVIDGEEEFISKIQSQIYQLFDITGSQQIYIKEKINGTFNK